MTAPLAFDGMTFEPADGLDASEDASADRLRRRRDGGAGRADLGPARRRRSRRWPLRQRRGARCSWSTGRRRRSGCCSASATRRGDAARTAPSAPRSAGSPRRSTSRTGARFRHTCDADLGDARCGVDLDDPAYRGDGTVSAADRPAAVHRRRARGFAAGWFDRGRLHLDQRRQRRPRDGSARASPERRRCVTIELWQPMHVAIAPATASPSPPAATSCSRPAARSSTTASTSAASRICRATTSRCPMRGRRRQRRQTGGQMSTSRSDIVAEALSWVGTPYRHQASLKGVGCDCLGLIRGVWRDLYGAEPEAAPAYTPDWAEAKGGETLAAAARRHLIEIAAGRCRGRGRAALPLAEEFAGEACRDPGRRRPFRSRATGRGGGDRDADAVVATADRVRISLPGNRSVNGDTRSSGGRRCGRRAVRADRHRSSAGLSVRLAGYAVDQALFGGGSREGARLASLDVQASTRRRADPARLRPRAVVGRDHLGDALRGSRVEQLATAARAGSAAQRRGRTRTSPTSPSASAKGRSPASAACGRTASRST